MKTKHYDKDMLLAIKRAARDIQIADTNIANLPKVTIEVVNVMPHEYDGLAHFEKWADMNKELFKIIFKKILIYDNPNRVIYSANECQVVYLEAPTYRNVEYAADPIDIIL